MSNGLKATMQHQVAMKARLKDKRSNEEHESVNESTKEADEGRNDK